MMCVGIVFFLFLVFGFHAPLYFRFMVFHHIYTIWITLYVSPSFLLSFAACNYMYIWSFEMFPWIISHLLFSPWVLFLDNLFCYIFIPLICSFEVFKLSLISSKVLFILRSAVFKSNSLIKGFFYILLVPISHS